MSELNASSSPHPPSAAQQAEIAAHRKRYDELKAVGQGKAPRALPPPTLHGSAAIAPAAIIHREHVPGGWYWTTRLDLGDGLRIINTDGASCVSIQAWNLADTSERLNHADTVKVQWAASLRKGRVILSDMGRVLLDIIEDTSGAHDTLVGGSTPADFGGSPRRNTRDNFILAAGKLGLDVRDVHPCVSFFAPVSVDSGGRFKWDATRRQAGDFVDLRAEMELLVALSNCAHPLDPLPVLAPGAVEIIRYRTEPGSGEICRAASAEAARAFENNALFLAQAAAER
jgi:uncharacterized protein